MDERPERVVRDKRDGEILWTWQSVRTVCPIRTKRKLGTLARSIQHRDFVLESNGKDERVLERLASGVRNNHTQV